MVTRYIWNILVALDQFFNALFGGDPDETISSRAAKSKARGQRWGCVLCQVLHWFDRGHCERVVEHDEGVDALASDGGAPDPFWRFWLAALAAGVLAGLMLDHIDSREDPIRSSVAATLCWPAGTMLRPDLAIPAWLRSDRGV